MLGPVRHLLIEPFRHHNAGRAKMRMDVRSSPATRFAGGLNSGVGPGSSVALSPASTIFTICRSSDTRRLYPEHCRRR
jgi:hypothetical protein